MKLERRKASLRCAIYTRVSTENGLEQEFNSLDNQREASEAYIRSQAHEGWKLIRYRYDDGGFSGGSMDRPALARLLDDFRARKIDVIVVYKVDRLTRSLADFAKLVELFDEHDVAENLPAAGAERLGRLQPRERTGPRAHAAHVIVHAIRALREIDGAVFLLQHGRERRLRRVLRFGDELTCEVPR